MSLTTTNALRIAAEALAAGKPDDGAVTVSRAAIVQLIHALNTRRSKPVEVVDHAPLLKRYGKALAACHAARNIAAAEKLEPAMRRMRAEVERVAEGLARPEKKTETVSEVPRCS